MSKVFTEDIAEKPSYGTLVKPQEESDEKKEKKTKSEMVSIIRLFRYASALDWLMMIIGTLGAAGAGASFPLMMLLFTNIIDSFTEYESLGCNITTNYTNFTNQTIDFDLSGKMSEQAIYLSILGSVTIFLNYFQVTFWIMPSERQTLIIRKMLFSSILRQDISWFDTYKEGSLTNRLTDDVNKIKDGLGDKFGNCIQFVATFLSGMIIGLVRGWKLSLVILALSPVLFILAVVFTKLVGVMTSTELKSYAKAGSVAEEVIGAIRTVFAFNGVQKDHARYEKRLESARKIGIKKSAINGLLMGTVWLVIYGAYALGFWYGWTLTEIDPETGKQEYTVGKILLVFFSIIMAVFSLGNAAPFITTLATARASAYEVFRIIDRKPEIDSQSDKGEVLNNLSGNIDFNQVTFKYPSRPEVTVLNGTSLQVRTGQTVALVGSSGSGKSTCIQLLQRFYDSQSGGVTIDGHDVKNLNINWLRGQIGVVNQEPILFATSIRENILYGKENATEAEMVQAAKTANAHQFIMELPKKYDTLVGDRGSQLSGGQKQRIAIARALIRNPKILLLDEATSALDNQSEAIVQGALDQARLGRTTIVVAHRLSTIRNADVIYVLDKGRVVEFGSHDELMKRKEAYYGLVLAQEKGASKDETETKNKALRLRSIDKTEDINLGEDKKEESEKTKEEKKKKPDVKRVFKMNKPEWWLILVGCLACIVTGGLQPAFSIIFSKVISVFSLCDRDEQETEITMYCIIFISLGFAAFLGNFVQSLSFGISGENLTKRVRSAAFKAMLSQEVGWYDMPENNVGTLTTRLATEAAAVQGATGVRLGGALMNVANLGVGLVLAFVYGWAITLLILGFIPFMIISGVLQTKLMVGFSGKNKEAIEEAGKFTSEAIGNIRTVAILSKETYFAKVYAQKIDGPFKQNIKSANVYGIMLGFTNSIMFYAMAAAFVLGAYLVEQRLFGMDFERIMLVFGAVIFGAQSVGQAASMMPDYAKAQVSIVNILELLDRKPLINNWTSADPSQKSVDLNGEIKFDLVEFTYPARREVTVLNKLSMRIKPGQKIALVGSSGCGKSTVTQLLERFYDPDDGSVSINNLNLKDIDLHHLRSQMGIVSQEPVLFDTSIAENIAYGDNSRQVTMDEIIAAAKMANIHDTIINFPEGYETNVGAKGTQLSGGQKQRISIARAMVRNPKILLLDEATSALDSESEKVVQEALEKAQVGRTCIVIAHRLSTIRNSDVIFVVQNGQITEAGNHEELMRLNGFYAKLNNRSALNSE